MSDKKKVFEDQSKMPLAAISEGDMRWNKTGSWRNVRPFYDNNTSPCITGCTAGEDIQGYIALALKGKYEEAVRLIWESNPFPAICGRVCYHPCMEKCARKEYDEALFIPAIERFLGDYAIEKKLREKTARKKQNHKIAVIGGGPSGLTCSYYLAKKGYSVVIFEKRNALGGVLRYGIPEYRLPKNVLYAEIDRLTAMGVEVRTGTTAGKDKSGGLDGYSAYFLGVGLQKSRRLSIDGEDSAGVIPGLEFLSDINEGRKVELGRKIFVVGGGNTAMDVARSALRLGSDVTVLYRRTEAEMPAIVDEVREAREEGVKFKFLSSPIRITAEKGRLKTIECQEMELGAPDDSGRRRPVPKDGAVFSVEADNMLVAVGELPDAEPFSAMIDIDNGLVIADEFGKTSNRKVFAGGDIVTGAATVVDAVARGRSAAELIDAELSGGMFNPRTHKKVIALADLNTAYFYHNRRTGMRKTSEEKIAGSFDEVNKGWSSEELDKELERCFSCGVCNGCDNCWIFCPDVAISREDGVYTVNYDYCKGCLICVQECPRASLSSEEEGQ